MCLELRRLNPDPITPARPKRTAVASALLVLLAAPDALAGDDDPAEVQIETAETRAAPRARWYGWQTMLVDGASVAALVAAPPIGLAVYAFAPPAVHAIHRNPRSMMLSLAFRVGAPVLMAGAGWGIGSLLAPRESGDDTWGMSGGMALVGFLGGMISAHVVDVVWLAREPERLEPTPGDAPSERDEPPAPSVAERARLRVHVAPSFAAGPRTLTIGAMGSF